MASLACCREPIRGSISPRGWALPPARSQDSTVFAALGLSSDDLRTRARRNVGRWMCHQYDPEIGAFRGGYDAQRRTFGPPENGNLVGPLACLAAFDRYGDERLLLMARGCADWVEGNLACSDPMGLAPGGVRDCNKPIQLWTKHTADYVILNVGLWERLHEETFLGRALHGSRFLVQSQNHGFAPEYELEGERWIADGWQSFGRVIVAMIALQDCTGDTTWLQRAKAWADYGLSLQAQDGCFRLVNGTHYSSGVAAAEIRGLTRMYLRSREQRFLDAAVGFSEWHLRHQAENGSWPLNEDRWGTEPGPIRRPGDAADIATALLLVHRVSGEARYVLGAARAIVYSLGQQQLPGRPDLPFADDLTTHWGFWSWDPPYDYTMSVDQSTLHARAYWFFLDYLLSLDHGRLAELHRWIVDRGIGDDSGSAGAAGGGGGGHAPEHSPAT